MAAILLITYKNLGSSVGPLKKKCIPFIRYSTRNPGTPKSKEVYATEQPRRKPKFTVHSLRC